MEKKNEGKNCELVIYAITNQDEVCHLFVTSHLIFDIILNLVFMANIMY